MVEGNNSRGLKSVFLLGGNDILGTGWRVDVFGDLFTRECEEESGGSVEEGLLPSVCGLYEGR